MVERRRHWLSWRELLHACDKKITLRVDNVPTWKSFKADQYDRFWQQYQEGNQPNICCRREGKIERPVNVRISDGLRIKRFGCANFMLRTLYQFMRTLFLSVWFYYLPLLFVVFATVQPVLTYLEEYERCVGYASNDCIGAITTECIEICNSDPRYQSLEELMASIVKPGSKS